MKFEELEKLRKKTLKYYGLGILFAVGSFLICFFIINRFFMDTDMGPTFQICIIVGILFGMAFFIKGTVIFNKMRKEFKYKHLKPLIESQYPTLVYNPEKGLSEEFVNGTGLYKRADRYKSEDMLTGTLEGVDFVSSDVELEERHVHHTKNGTQVYYVSYFKGRIFRFEFNKSFKDTVLVTEGQRPGAYSYLKKVELESIEFNRKFKTFCKEDINAFYVLTPQLIIAFLELERKNPGVISVLITSKYLYMGINNSRDTFEISLTKEINSKILNDYMYDINVSMDIVKELKLNKKIFNDENL